METGTASKIQTPEALRFLIPEEQMIPTVTVNNFNAYRSTMNNT